MRLKPFLILIIFLSILTIQVKYIMSNNDSTLNNDQYNPAKTIVKFSFLGVQDKPIASLVFCTDDKKITIEKLKALKLFYINDEYELQNILVSEDELSNIIQVAMLFKELADTDNPRPELAVVILNTESSISINYKLGADIAKKLYNKVEPILKQNVHALEKLKHWGLRARLT